jgi:hypothetical protein
MDHGSWIIREDAGHRRQIADVSAHDAEERDDGGLVRGDAVEVTHTTLLGTISFLKITRGRKDHMIRLRANAIPINRKPA